LGCNVMNFRLNAKITSVYYIYRVNTL
jgi:hypothetical protein